MDVVVIPTYNEADNIGPLVARLPSRDSTLHVLVVDDSSPDGTADLVRALPDFGSRVFLLSRAEKDGLGAAYRDGFGWAHERGYDRVVQMDADGSHDPSDVPRLLEAVARADTAIGSRYCQGGDTVGWSYVRQVISRGGNGYVRLVLGLPVQDCTAGFRAYRSAGLAAQVSGGSESNGYAFQIESTLRAHEAGLDVVELPIVFRDRERGRSKMSTRIVVEALWRVACWRFERRSSPPRPGGVQVPQDIVGSRSPTAPLDGGVTGFPERPHGVGSPRMLVALLLVFGIGAAGFAIGQKSGDGETADDQGEVEDGD